jgi:hypothetical protein
MSGTSCAGLEDHRELWKTQICLSPVSKDVSGELRLFDSELQQCSDQECRTLKTDHVMTLNVNGNRDDRCDSRLAGILDGRLLVRPLITALIDDGEHRGTHTGDFIWKGAGARVEGTLSGMTNVGTHRKEPFEPCQECFAPGYMEGRLCGQIVRAAEERLVGCTVTAVYLFRFDASQGFRDSPVSGTIEGVVVCACETSDA